MSTNMGDSCLTERKALFEYICQESLNNWTDIENKEVSSKILKKSIYETSFDSSQVIRDHMTWVTANGHLRMNKYEIPENIVPGGKNSALYDIKVWSKGPDDAVFDKNKDIRAKVARGNTILETVDSNGQKNYDLIVYALRKFSGGLGDEDDMDRANGSDWKKYFLKDLDQTKYVVSMKKANGEAAHMSCRCINNEFVICAGSKNVHLVFKNNDDLLKCEKPNADLARLIGETVLKHLSRMDSEKRRMLLSFLCWTRFTVIFEILNPLTQHVENLSYLKEPLLKFITFSGNKLYDTPESLCTLPPELSIEIGKLFEFSCVEYKKIPFKDVEDYLLKVRADYGYEGVVLYFLDSDFNTIGLLKKKTTWYIIIRAVREKLRSYVSPKSTQSLDDLKQRISKRLKDIQKWIGFTEDDLKKWLALSVSFAEWFDDSFRQNRIKQNDHSEKFPVLWSDFLEQTNSNDHIDLHIA